MTPTDLSLRDVVDALRAEQLLDDRAARAYLADHGAPQPWYVRAMVGLGAWLASVLVIGFVAGFGLLMDGGYLLIGLGLMVSAVLVRRRYAGDFLVQGALATSLAGQALFAYGLAELTVERDIEVFLGVALVMNAILFLAFPDRIHRTLMVLFATAALATLLYIWEMNALVPLLGPALTAALVVVHSQMPHIVGSAIAPLVRPLTTGLMLSAFGVLLISTAYVLPELDLGLALYPRPWISTLLLGALLLYLGSWIWPVLAGPGNHRALLVLYGMTGAVIASAWAAPGLLLGLIVVLLGAASGRRSFVGAGIAFLAVFVASYFYGIEVTLPTKAAVLITSGTALLVARWAVLRLASAAAAGGMDHG